MIDRKDDVINLFEIKFYNKEFSMTKAYADNLRQKMWRFEEITQTKKQIFWVFISSHGLKENEHSLDIINKSLIIDNLF